MEALTSVKTAAEIGSIAKDLSVDQIDTLMKYIYKGMSKPESYNAATLLTWHEKVVIASFPLDNMRKMCHF